jgi:hypothetical protein
MGFRMAYRIPELAISPLSYETKRMAQVLSLYLLEENTHSLRICPIWQTFVLSRNYQTKTNLHHPLFAHCRLRLLFKGHYGIAGGHQPILANLHKLKSGRGGLILECPSL